jgi:hypothetical protein
MLTWQVRADVTRGLDDGCNSQLRDVLESGVDLILCAYVLVET